MNRSARWTLLIAAILTGLVLCAVPMLTSRTSTSSTSTNAASSDRTDGGEGAAASASGVAETDGTASASGVTSGASSTEDPSDQRLPACPAPVGATGSTALAADAPLRSVTLPCLGNGTTHASSRSLAENLAGKPTVLNIWAWWCQPCRAELPHVAELATEHPEWNVVGIHDYTDPDAGIQMLNDLHISNLASFQDGDGKVIGTLGLPAVIPITVVLRADGTVAQKFVQVFENTDQLEQAVQGALG